METFKQIKEFKDWEISNLGRCRNILTGKFKLADKKKNHLNNWYYRLNNKNQIRSIRKLVLDNFNIELSEDFNNYIVKENIKIKNKKYNFEIFKNKNRYLCYDYENRERCIIPISEDVNEFLKSKYDNFKVSGIDYK